MQILHELLKEAMDGRLLKDGPLVGHLGSGLPRGEPRHPVAGRQPGVGLGFDS